METELSYHFHTCPNETDGFHLSSILVPSSLLRAYYRMNLI